MRILVAIAHHGSKNRRFLLRMLDSLRAIEHDVDIVTRGEEHKDLPDDVEQVVGLPSEDPWSLPFAHRSLFADRRDEYDLFVYAEDDTLFGQRHLDTFLELDALLPDHLLPGFMRYELDEGGERSYCTVHSYYRWDPGSAFQVDGLTFARFTNDHAALFALTRTQLDRAIASGGFLVEPHKGVYGMPESAATDVYTRCGFQKVMCVDRIEDQLVHHMPNIYLGRMGVEKMTFVAQLDRLRELARDTRPASGLFRPESRMTTRVWDRSCYPKLPTDLETLVPHRPAKVLTVGASSGDLEAHLIALGHQVVAIPTDPVFAGVLQRRGIDHLECELPPASVLSERGPFDRVLALDTLPYVPDPIALLTRLRTALAPDGALVATVPDHRRYALRNLVPRAVPVDLPVTFGIDGVHRTDRATLRGWLEAARYDVCNVQHRSATRNEPVGTGGLQARATGNSILARATPALDPIRTPR